MCPVSACAYRGDGKIKTRVICLRQSKKQDCTELEPHPISDKLAINMEEFKCSMCEGFLYCQSNTMNGFPFCFSETLVHLLKMSSCVLFYPIKSTYYQSFIYQELGNRRESVLWPLIACSISTETRKSRAGKDHKRPPGSCLCQARFS